MSKKIHRGGDLRDFLAEQGILGEVEARALKQALTLQLERLLNEQALTKTQMATRMKTSRAAVECTRRMAVSPPPPAAQPVSAPPRRGCRALNRWSFRHRRPDAPEAQGPA